MANDGAERTETATPRRRNKEREKGNIAKSKDLMTAITITIAIVMLAVFSGWMMNRMQLAMHLAFTNLNPKNINLNEVMGTFYPYAKIVAQALLPFMCSMFVLTIFALRLQIGHMFALDKIKPKFDALSPKKWVDGLKRLINPFEPNKLVELAKSLLKVSIVFACGYSVLHSRMDELYALLGAEIPVVFKVIGSILSQMFLNMLLAMLFIGFLDLKFQTYMFEKSIKMTKQEVKDEMKDTEGDPKIKGKIKAFGYKLLQQQMMAQVPTADVVVTNPTHFAVALKYDRSIKPAPYVVAKGADFIAFKIREVAQNNNVPIVENVIVARTLYQLVQIGDIIPSEMFQAVAEILAYVYNKNNRTR
ncbi:MAG: flagellar biosynthesis protein FlhB [Candidatus Gastranaerophilaceae bacterium]